MPPAQSKPDQLHRHVRDDILALAFEPGQALRLPSLSEAYGVGLTPLRECLTRLKAERLVQVEHNKGFRVAPLTAEDLLDLEHSRNAIEGSLFVRSVAQGDDIWESGVIGTYHQLARTQVPSVLQSQDTLALWTDRHARFHTALIAGAPSTWLHSFRDQVNDQLSRYQRYIQRGLRRMAKSQPDVAGRAAEIFARAMALEPHTALYDAALARDPDAAQRCFEAHGQLSVCAFEELVTMVPVDGSGASATEETVS
ncbi:transcriptional regulator [Roseobacter cerasinus]|uniref:Transcriptional regulator n=1 Tax=Roseobacter cerasinus TaxID=2602289 RepID=A0A640VWC7_9RHOB|nr:GntR family transcriptional regulator [Roseobacter cerasinus]GFE51381.1 transcriptional regulator [Roseobacter cerasinus]